MRSMAETGSRYVGESSLPATRSLALAIHERQCGTGTQAAKLDLGPMVVIVESGVADRSIGPAEVLCNGCQHALDAVVAAGIDLYAANGDQLRPRGFNSADMTSGHDDLFEISRLLRVLRSRACPGAARRQPTAQTQEQRNPDGSDPGSSAGHLFPGFRADT